MQSKQINADGTTRYAYAKEYEWQDRAYSPRRAKQVVVTEVGAPRQAWSSGAYRPHTKNDGVRVTFVDDDGNVGNRSDVVRPQEIRQLWDEYTSEAKAAEDARLAKAKRDREARRQLLAQWEEAKAKLPKGTSLPWSFSKDEPYDHGDVRLYELAQLIKAAYLNGFRDGQADALGTNEQEA